MTKTKQTYFKDRFDAGRKLSNKLSDFKGEDIVVMAISKGGVEVGYEVAKNLGAPLDITIVRRICMPYDPDFSIGALGENGIRILDKSIINWMGISNSELEKVTAQELKELEKLSALFHQNLRYNQSLKDKTLILVDDGLFRGLTVRTAIQCLAQEGPKKIIVAVPVAPPEVVLEMKPEVFDVICLEMPRKFKSIADYYEEFSSPIDEEIVNLLNDSREKVAIS